MNMNFFQSIIMGFVSGFAELLPISAQAHRALLRSLMGLRSEDPVFLLILHIATLAALLWCCRGEVQRLRRTSALLRIPPRRRRHQPDMPSVYTIRLLRTASVLLCVGKLFTMRLSFIANELQILAFSVLANGILLLIPSLVRNGNKDSRNMPRLDGMLMGLGAGLSVIPGISQVGATVSIGISRGVDRRYALKFAYLLLIPGMLIQIVFDVIALAVGGAIAFTGLGLAVAFAGGIGCFLGCLIGYKLMNFLAFSTNFSAFSYYCFGVGLFSFVLFLTI